jgi:hypothetical protein
VELECVGLGKIKRMVGCRNSNGHCRYVFCRNEFCHSVGISIVCGVPFGVRPKEFCHLVGIFIVCVVYVLPSF